MSTLIQDSIQSHVELARKVQTEMVKEIQAVAEILIRCLKNGGRIYWCGNGGSAADAQHLAGELIGRFERNRRSIPSMALTSDMAVLTAIGNDFGYAQVFERQVEGLVTSKDVLIGISTSGNSENIVLAIRKARQIGAKTIGLLGRNGGKIKPECEVSLVIPHENTARIQEMHKLIGHILCDLIEREYV